VHPKRNGEMIGLFIVRAAGRAAKRLESIARASRAGVAKHIGLCASIAADWTEKHFRSYYPSSTWNWQAQLVFLGCDAIGAVWQVIVMLHANW
jgi:hypothetical protein